MTKSDETLTAFKSGFTCSSAVVSAFSDELGFDGETAKKIACGFGAGISEERQYSWGQFRGDHGERPQIREDASGG